MHTVLKFPLLNVVLTPFSYSVIAVVILSWVFPEQLLRDRHFALHTQFHLILQQCLIALLLFRFNG